MKGALVGALGVGSLGALTKNAVDAFAKQERAIAALDASIISMDRNTAGLSRQIQTLASQIQREGIIGDEAIIQGASFLTTYKDITDQLLPRTIRVMADLSAKMGGDVRRAANLLGKASMGLVGQLSIAGISLSDAAKESKDFEIILGEIEEQVGGMNAALGRTSTGALTQFGNALGDMKEVLGGIVSVAIEPFISSFVIGLGGAGKSMDEINVLGERFRSWLIEAAKNMAFLADAIAGIQFAWLGLKNILAGFGLAVVATVREIARAASFIGRIFGQEFISADSLMMIDDAFKSQMQTVRDLKMELGDMVEELETAPSFKLKAEIDRIAFQAEVDMMRRRLGLEAGGTFRQDPPTPPATQQGPTETRDPQLSDTNSILMDIRRDLATQRGAIAG